LRVALCTHGRQRMWRRWLRRDSVSQRPQAQAFVGQAEEQAEPRLPNATASGDLAGADSHQAAAPPEAAQMLAAVAMRLQPSPMAAATTGQSMPTSYKRHREDERLITGRG
jgi:hypothetical protein